MAKKKQEQPTTVKPGDAIIYHHDPTGKEKPWSGVVVSVGADLVATLSLQTPGGESTGANVPHGEDFGHWEAAPRG